jgi:hypothetical protein
LSARAFGTFLAFPGEGHGLRRPESIRRALEVELFFYVAALGLSSGKPDTPVAIEDAIVAGPPDQRLRRQVASSDRWSTGPTAIWLTRGTDLHVS